MPASWLHQIGPDGLLVIPEMLARDQPTVLRTLNRQPLTKLYRLNYSRSRRADALGLFWADVPPLALIPVVRSRHSPPAWLSDYVAFWGDQLDERDQRRAVRHVKKLQKGLSPDEGLSVKWTEGGRKVVATMLKPNPKFELVVINKHDRAALLKLLAEMDAATNVSRWLAARTRQVGASPPSVLHADYVAWCERESEAAAGMKGFVQALVGAGVNKLTRAAGSARYELELR